MTVGTVFMAAFATCYIYITTRKINIFAVNMTVSYAFGAVLMFSSGAYSAEGLDGSHPMPQGLSGYTSHMYDNYFKIISPHGIANNIFLNICIAALVVMLVVKADNLNKGLFRRWFGLGVSLFMPLYIMYTFMRMFHRNLPFADLVLLFDGLLSFLFIAAFFLSILIYMRKGRLKDTALFALLSAGAICAPLLVVTPIGERCLFIAYSLFILAAGGLFVYLKDLYFTAYTKVFARVCAFFPTLALLGVFVMLFGIYGKIWTAEAKRHTFVIEQIERADPYADEVWITMPVLPLEDYIWNGTPKDSYLSYIYKLYHKMPDNVKFRVISYDDWKDNY
jgi:hypothetical protein